MDTAFSIRNYEDARGQLICRLVRADNMNLWRDTAYMAAFADLYAIPCIYQTKQDGIADSCPVSLLQAAVWGVSSARLHTDAVANMRRLFPPTLDRMENLMESSRIGSVRMHLLALLQKGFPDTPEDKLSQIAGILARRVGQRAMDAGGLKPMWVLGNTAGYYGAASVLYPGVPECFANEIESGFYILPSSVNDVIFLPEGGAETRRMLYEMVASANRKMGDKERILSNSVYYFDRNKMEIRLF